MMFAFGKIVGALTAVPGLGIFLILISLLFLANRKSPKARGFGMAFLVMAMLSFVVFSFKPVSALLLRPLEKGQVALAPIEDLDKAQFDGYHAVVVLGAESMPLSPEEGGRTALSPVMSSRLVYGLRLAKKLGLPLIISGATGEDGNQDGMVLAAARIIKDFGVEDIKLSLEAKSMTTWENAVEVRKLMDQRGAPRGKIILVTSAWHMSRSVMCFRKQGMEVLPAPTDYRTSEAPFTFYDWLPSTDGLKMANIASHEFIGKLSYSLKKARKD